MTGANMMKSVTGIFCLLAIAGYASAGLEVSNAGGGSIALPTGTESVVLNVDYVNDTGGTVTLLGAEVLDFVLNVTPYVGSGPTAPTLDNPNPSVLTTPFVDLGVTSVTAPLGTLGANNFVGFTVLNGASITLGTLSVTIPADFLGEFVLAQSSGDQLAVSLIEFADPVNVGLTVDGTTTVGTGTPVPEPSSFLFLGLVGTGALGLRRYTRRNEEDEELE